MGSCKSEECGGKLLAFFDGVESLRFPRCARKRTGESGWPNVSICSRREGIRAGSVSGDGEYEGCAAVGSVFGIGGSELDRGGQCAQQKGSFVSNEAVSQGGRGKSVLVVSGPDKRVFETQKEETAKRIGRTDAHLRRSCKKTGVTSGPGLFSEGTPGFWSLSSSTFSNRRGALHFQQAMDKSYKN